MLILLAIVASVAIMCCPAFSQDVWDITADFSSTSSTGVNGQWNYGFCEHGMISSGAYTFTAANPVFFLPQFVQPGVPGCMWLADGFSTNMNGDRAPFVGAFWDSSLWWMFPASTPPLDVYMQGSKNTGFAPVIRWTAPSTGNFGYSGRLAPAAYNNWVDFYVIKRPLAGGYSVIVPKTTMKVQGVESTFSGTVALAAGDNLDLIVTQPNLGSPDLKNGYALVADYKIIGGENPGVRGYVKDAGGAAIPGARVSDGTRSILAGSDGYYELVIPVQGTYNIVATKPSYVSGTYENVVIGASGMQTKNFTLPVGNTISGVVTSNVGGFPLINVKIDTSDGAYGPIYTDSAGQYSIRVTPGTHNINFNKPGFSPRTDSVVADAPAGGAAITHNVFLAVSWDLAAEYNSGSNPSGNWEWGILDQNGNYGLLGENGTLDWYGYLGDWGENLRYGWVGFEATTVKNHSAVAHTAYDSNWNWPYVEPGKVVASAGQSPYITLGGYEFAREHLFFDQSVLAKFTVPGGGDYTIKARFGASATQAPANVPIALRYKPAGSNDYIYWLGQSTSPRSANMTFIDGFQGTSANGYTDSTGTTPVITFEQVKTLQTGDTIEAVVGFNADVVMNESGQIDVNGTGQRGRYVQMDLTIEAPPGSATIGGTCRTANLTGNPIVTGVRVTATSTTDGKAYGGVSNADGLYFVMVPAGTYTIATYKPGYQTATSSATVAVGGTAVVNFSLTGTFARTFAELKAIPDGQGVTMLTPMQLTCSTKNGWGFNKKFASYTTSTDSSGNQIWKPVPEYWFSVQTPDRAGGIRVVHNGTLPRYDNTYRITFAGILGTDANGQRYINVSSIDSATQVTTTDSTGTITGVAPIPLGKTSKGLIKPYYGSLVKVWGKITQKVANPMPNFEKYINNGVPDLQLYPYEYIVINDGGQDIKIPTHVQFNGMPHEYFGPLDIGDYITVTGIAGTTNGTDVAVYPRHHDDIFDYNYYYGMLP
jgi:hypothetical protein